jgi:hypothetical protein
MKQKTNGMDEQRKGDVRLEHLITCGRIIICASKSRLAANAIMQRVGHF